MLRVTQTRSAIGVKPKHRGTLRALGLRRPGRSNTLPDRREIRGMIHRVRHLVEVETVDRVPGSDTGPVGVGAAAAGGSGVGAVKARAVEGVAEIEIEEVGGDDDQAA